MMQRENNTKWNMVCWTEYKENVNIIATSKRYMIPILTAALFTITTTWNYLSVHCQRNKENVIYACMCICIHKRKKSYHFNDIDGTWEHYNKRSKTDTERQI